MGVFGKEKFDWAFNYPNTRFDVGFCGKYCSTTNAYMFG